MYLLFTEDQECDSTTHNLVGVCQDFEKLQNYMENVITANVEFHIKKNEYSKAIMEYNNLITKTIDAEFNVEVPNYIDLKVLGVAISEAKKKNTTEHIKLIQQMDDAKKWNMLLSEEYNKKVKEINKLKQASYNRIAESAMNALDNSTVEIIKGWTTVFAPTRPEDILIMEVTDMNAQISIEVSPYSTRKYIDGKLV